MQRESLLRQIIWDYNIPVEDIDAVLRGRMETAGHLTRSDIFRRILESYPWFTVLEIFTPEEIKALLNKDVIKKLRSPSLKKKYEFISRRLQEVILSAG
ncbi:MAG: hypothetical protein V1903_02495 [Bacteroidota bacterium]